MLRKASGSVFVIMALNIVITLVAVFLFGFPLLLFAGGDVNTTSPLEPIAEYIAGTIAAPIAAIATVLLYYDRRVRLEAFDLEFMMAALDGKPVPAPRTESGVVTTLGDITRR